VSDPAAPESAATPAAVVVAEQLADGDWHRLHPATPLLRGGIAFVAILGIIIVNLRDFFIELFIGGNEGDEDLIVVIIESGYVLPAVGAIIGGLLLAIAFFWISWRMHTFRITEELVEVKSGVVFRTHRRGRLDRIQGINIVRPFFARLFGAAKLEINVAGQDANVQLAYLGSAAADALRLEILRLASGSQRAAVAASGPAGAQVIPGSGVIAQRANELLAPELDPNEAEPESVVQMHPGRLIGSILLSGSTFMILVIGVGVALSVVFTGEFFFLFGIVPAVIGFGSYYVSKFTKSLRYSIASTRNGIRVGFGLLTTSNDTLPPGRIHAVQVNQPLLWRPFGWWEIKINKASHSSTEGAAGQANTTILPVGSMADVRKVLELVLPTIVDPESIALLERGLTSRGWTAEGGDDGFVNSPRRARVIRWFSWRRNGFAVTEDSVLLRRGAIFRELIVVPQARIQSLSLSQGPLLRRLRLASVRLHTVAGPVIARLGAIDQEQAVAFFGQAAEEAVRAGVSDTTHRWRSGEAPA
jgi:putative membrane protein